MPDSCIYAYIHTHTHTVLYIIICHKYTEWLTEGEKERQKERKRKMMIMHIHTLFARKVILKLLRVSHSKSVNLHFSLHHSKPHLSKR